MPSRTLLQSTLLFAVVLALSAPLAQGGALATIVSGYNPNAPTTPVDIPYNFTSSGYSYSAPLFFDPNAGWIIKTLTSPQSPSGGPLLIDALQPIVFPVDEEFTIVPGPVPTPGPKDWHERIVTDGWVWVPSNARTSLITRNGQPWPSTPEDVPLTPQPTQLDIFFPEITPGNVLDIHKGLLFVGTPTNRIWGDETSEATITIIEYPTPEPASIVLAIFGLASLFLMRRRRV